MYKEKYKKYKLKYLNLKGQIGGVISEEDITKYQNEEHVIVPEIPDIDDLGIFVYLKINENLKKLTFTNIRQIIEKIENETNFKTAIYNLLEQTNVTHIILSGSNDSKIENEHLKTLATVLSYYKNVTHIDLTNNQFNIIDLYKFIRYLRVYDFNHTLNVTMSNPIDFNENKIDALKKNALEKNIVFTFI